MGNKRKLFFFWRLPQEIRAETDKGKNWLLGEPPNENNTRTLDFFAWLGPNFQTCWLVDVVTSEKETNIVHLENLQL